MQTRHPLFKIAAASCFVLLITAFVVYKAGAFTNNHQSVNTGEIVSSGQFTGNEDSLKKKTKADSLKQAQKRTRMYSTKSAPVFEESEFLLPVEPIHVDTTKKDSTRKDSVKKSDANKPKASPVKTENNKNNAPVNNVKTRGNMPGSKSGRIFEPNETVTPK